MAKVIAWPPLGFVAWELTKSHPTSRSSDMFGKPDRTSSVGRPRYLATAIIEGVGKGHAAAGYVEMLKGQMEGGAHFVRVPSMAPLYMRHARGRPSLRASMMEWTANGADLYWTAGSDDLVWYDQIDITGTPSVDNGWPAIQVIGLPAGVQIRPSEWVAVVAPGPVVTRRALTATKADENGVALIRLDDAFEAGGVVSIGGKRDLVFQAADMPRAIQPVSGDWSFEWRFREVFADEVGGFEDVDPWR